MKKELKANALILALALPLALGGLSAFLTKDWMLTFDSVLKPPLSPPAWLFPIAWTLLYILMGLASYLVWTAPVSPARRDRALGAYALNLALNFLWPLIFFGMELYLLAFIWLSLLWLAAAASTVLFWYIRQGAGRLMLPYMAWLSFAGYLNFAIWLINK